MDFEFVLKLGFVEVPPPSLMQLKSYILSLNFFVLLFAFAVFVKFIEYYCRINRSKNPTVANK